tara:strand:- start:449 stop:1993 length:1545 start_codon:yes stop_codon:yes gene_type:complete
MPKDQVRVKTLRNQTKAYDMEDQLKAEYSIMLNGQRLPLLTKSFKGFTSKASKSGKTRFNKLFNAPQSVKQEYINAVNTALNMHTATAKADVGDNMKNQNVSSKSGEQKQEKNILLHSKLQYDKAPDSVAVFNEDKKQDEEKAEEPLEEEEPKPMPKAPVMKKGGKAGGVLQGPSHDNGGIKVEMEGGEYVVNKESTKHFEKELSKMNDIGNQLRDAKQPQLRSRKMKKINQMKRKMRKGGVLKYRAGGVVSEIEQPTTGRGLLATLSKDDGVKDKGMYQELINKYFTKMDFTQTLKYVKNKNKDVEKMGADALREKAQDIAQQVKTQVKYNGSVVAQLKKQVYELIAIRLALQQQPKKQEQKGNIGLVVDMESVFGEGAEVDKQAFAEKYMRGGKINQEQLKQDMGKPEDLENIVAQGKDGMTQPKPEQKKAFQDFQTLSAGEQSEGAISRGESSYTRKTFNLPMALNGSVEMGWRQRYAQEIDENNEEFKKPQSIFKYRKKNNKKGRRNLLN